MFKSAIKYYNKIINKSYFKLTNKWTFITEFNCC